MVPCCLRPCPIFVGFRMPAVDDDGVGDRQHVEDGAGKNLLGKIVGSCERSAARIALDGGKAFKMRLLRGARGIG
jgi:hypothetical protein